jgi:hypothetical protein
MISLYKTVFLLCRVNNAANHARHCFARELSIQQTEIADSFPEERSRISVLSTQGTTSSHEVPMLLRDMLAKTRTLDDVTKRTGDCVHFCLARFSPKGEANQSTGKRTRKTQSTDHMRGLK